MLIHTVIRTWFFVGQGVIIAFICGKRMEQVEDLVHNSVLTCNFNTCVCGWAFRWSSTRVTLAYVISSHTYHVLPFYTCPTLSYIYILPYPVTHFLYHQLRWKYFPISPIPEQSILFLILNLTLTPHLMSHSSSEIAIGQCNELVWPFAVQCVDYPGGWKSYLHWVWKFVDYPDGSCGMYSIVGFR